MGIIISVRTISKDRWETGSFGRTTCDVKWFPRMQVQSHDAQRPPSCESWLYTVFFHRHLGMFLPAELLIATGACMPLKFFINWIKIKCTLKSLDFLLPWKHVLTFQIRWFHSIKPKLSCISDKWVCIREKEGKKADNLWERDFPAVGNSKLECSRFSCLDSYFIVHNWTKIASIYVFIPHLTSFTECQYSVLNTALDKGCL